MFINKEISIEIARVLTTTPKIFSELTLYHNGFKYSEHQYIVRNRRSIQKYYREFHNWTNPKFKGNKAKSNDDIL